MHIFAMNTIKTAIWIFVISTLNKSQFGAIAICDKHLNLLASGSRVWVYGRKGVKDLACGLKSNTYEKCVFEWFSKEMEGSGKVKEWVFNFIRVISMKGRRGIMKTKGILWRKMETNGGQLRVGEKGKWWFLSSLFSWNQQNFRALNGNSKWIFRSEAWGLQGVFKSQQFLVIKIFPWRLKKF